jgi:hypothetical protein
LTEPDQPATTARAASRIRRALGWLCADDAVLGGAMVLLVFYYVGTRGVFQGKASGDGWFGFLYLKAIFFKHTLDMQKVIPEYLPYFSTSGPYHRMPNRCPFGPAIVWAPFYLVAWGLWRLGELAHLVHPARGDEAFFAWFAGLGTLSGTLVGWRAAFVLLARNLGRTAARLGAISAMWATPLAWYVVTQPAYQHGLAFALAALLVERWDAGYGHADARRFLLYGLIGGAAMMMRAQEALYLLLPGAEVAWGVVRGPARGRWLAAGVALTVGAALAFSPQVAVWHYYTGTLSAPQLEPIRWQTPFLLTVLFSTRGGLFPWSPIAYLATAGLAAAFVRPPARRLALGLVAVGLVELYVIAAAWLPTGAYAYGARRLSDLALLLGLGVALAWEHASGRRLRQLVAGFAALCVALNVAAMELVRARRVASSGGYARTAGKWLEEAHAPAWLSSLFERVGYPFVQPVGWLFALRHRAPASAFEGVVGNFLLERDGQWFTVLNKEIHFDRFNHANVLGGLVLPPNDKEPAQVTGPVRLLLSMFAKEPFTVRVVGGIVPGPLSARWNGRPLEVAPAPDGLRLTVPAAAVEAGVNEVELELPRGSQLRRLEFNATSTWWR